MLRILLTFTLIIGFGSFAMAQDTPPPAEETPVQKGKVKAETEMTAKITKAISSDSSTIGEDVNFILVKPVEGEGLTLPPGAELYARIVDVHKAEDADDLTKISIMFDFVQAGEDFIPCKALIIGVEQMGEQVKLEASETFEGGTVLTLKGKGLQINEGMVFKVKLIKDLDTENK